MEKMYLVLYTSGSYDDYEEHIIFASANKSTATKYVTKFNNILKKWKEHFSQYNNKTGRITWIKDDAPKHVKVRSYKIHEINNCYWKEIKIK